MSTRSRGNRQQDAPSTCLGPLRCNVSIRPSTRVVADEGDFEVNTRVQRAATRRHIHQFPRTPPPARPQRLVPTLSACCSSSAIIHCAPSTQPSGNQPAGPQDVFGA